MSTLCTVIQASVLSSAPSQAASNPASHAFRLAPPLAIDFSRFLLTVLSPHLTRRSLARVTLSYQTYIYLSPVKIGPFIPSLNSNNLSSCLFNLPQPTRQPFFVPFAANQTITRPGTRYLINLASSANSLLPSTTEHPDPNGQSTPPVQLSLH